MPNVNKKESLSINFIPTQYSAKKNDPFFYLNQNDYIADYRKLTDKEIDILKKNNNRAEFWDEILVGDKFNPELIRNSEFYGRVTIGNQEDIILKYHDLKLPVGIYNSTIISCDIQENVVIRNVQYLAHYIISKNCILFNINEMLTTDHAKFGNGIIKEGEDENVRICIGVSNENEGRCILPFDSMIPADAYVWSKFRDDDKLMSKLRDITDDAFDKKRGYYGVVGSHAVIKNSRIIKDVKVGEFAYIKGANKLKNLTIHSSEEEPSQIGEGVELVNGIVGYGSKIFYGSKAIRFITGRNTQLKYGARLIHSVLGDNSTVSCCELLNNLIFPFHEQHHNNSFLIATTVLGQSNIAAGATIGSNHNSRAADGEIVAGRGFWPGLSISLKHNCKFASFVLASKGSYEYEMDIKYPFSLVLPESQGSSIVIMPAYWFMYNMYAVARNTGKFQERDKRKIKAQNIEVDYLAPDTVSEMIYSLDRIKFLLGEKLAEISGEKIKTKEEAIEYSDAYLEEGYEKEINLHDRDAMKKFGATIIKPVKAINVYKEMCLYFVLKSIYQYFAEKKINSLKELLVEIYEVYKTKLHTKWWNIGGQIMSDEDLESLKNDVKSGKLKSWESIHDRYDAVWEEYPKQKLRYALYVIECLTKEDISDMIQENWQDLFEEGNKVVLKVLKLSEMSRAKDYSDPFRKINYLNEKEMSFVLGHISDNSFLNNLKKETEELVNYFALLKKQN